MQIDGEKVETMTDFIFLGSKVTADNDCSHKIKRCLLLKRKVMTNLDSILKSRDIILLTIVHLVKAMVFPVVMYGCESWTIKKAECRKTDAFELWCWRNLLRDPWTSRRSNQSVLTEISLKIYWKDWCWSWNSNNWPPDVKNWLTGTDPDAGKDWRREEKGTTEDEMVGWHHQCNGRWVWVGSGSWWWTRKPGMLKSMGSQRVGQDWATELNWTSQCLWNPRGTINSSNLSISGQNHSGTLPAIRRLTVSQQSGTGRT